MTQQEWTNLSEKARWDIVAALRGPDLCVAGLKWFTTSVIRGRVVEIFNSHGLVNTDLNLVILPQGNVSTVKHRKDGFDFNHFYNHIQAAAEWLGLPILRVDPAVWDDAILTHGWTTNGGNSVLAAAKDYQGNPPLYQPDLINELARHMSSRIVSF